ncbi:MAG TPA: CARDB domain-containing protein [Candidatus Sulfomarinibacteraceae bacterium]|nr:CARDB domain-containing protein [Candidatus Sulfomarinibacteraceae bacterium]
MVEFALIILVLLFLLFVIIEGARILQANLTAQSAAREAGRYAITGQYDPSCLNDTPPCPDPRVASIKAQARAALGGLTLDDGAAYNDPQYYLIEVIGTDENGNQIPDYAGAPGMPVMVRVTYRVGMVTPLVQPIANTVRVIGQVVLNNEQFTQISTSNTRNEAPQLTPYPTAGPSPTPIPPNLQLTKSDSENPGPAIVGEPFFYVMSIVNIGQSDAEDAMLVDDLPDGIDYVSGPAGCEENDGVVTCEGIDVAANSSTTLNLRVVARPEVGDTTVSNTATISHPRDETPDNNSDTHETYIVGVPQDADLALAKSASATLIAVGNELVYTIGIVNNGLAEATDVTVVDTLPGGITFLSATPSQGSCQDPDGNQLTCELGDLARNESANVIIRVRPTQQGTITNTAEVSANEEDPDESNNQDSVDVDVRNVSDLSVTKLASANPGLGEEMTYTVNVVNNGPATATNVQMQDSLPPSVTVQSIDTSQGSCSGSGNVVDCSLGSLDPHTNATVSIVVIPNESGSITNYASVSGDQEDPFAPNDDFELNTTIQPRADLTVSKTGADEVEAGDTLTYRLVVTNNGPSAAEGIIVNDVLPPNVTFVSASASQGTCSGSNSAVTCSLEELANGATAEITIRVIPNVPGHIENTVHVNAKTVDPDGDNNSSSAQTEVTADNAYIVLDRICGRPGDQIEVKGYNWPTNENRNNSDRYELHIHFEDGVNEPIVLQSGLDNLSTWTYLVTIPEVEDGIHTVRAFREGAHNQNQGEIEAEDTAQLEIPCPAPNLVVSQPQLITPIGDIIAGEPVSFRAEVSNVGNLDAISQFFTGLYFDPSPEPTADDTHIDQEYRQDIVALNGLAAGATKVVTFTVDSGFETDGTHLVYAVADSDPGPEGIITTEHDETDNISTALEVEVTAPATPTPTTTPTATNTGTPGATPTPTTTPSATPTPAPTSAPGTLVVTIFNQYGEPQANAEINVYEEDGGALVATGYSDIDGNHFFTGLAPDTYTVTACITIESEDFFRSASGVIVSSGGVTQIVLFLQPSPAGCV